LLRNDTQCLGLRQIPQNDLGNGCLCRASLLETAASELEKYNLHLVAVQEVRWDNGGSQPADNYTFFYGNGNADIHLGTRRLYMKESFSS